MKLRAVLRAVVTPATERQRRPSSSLASLDDSQLLAAMRAGDPGVAGALCARLAPRVHGTVRRLLGPADPDADDATQKSLFAIVQEVDRFRGESSLDTWAAAVTARIVYKHIRRRRLERRYFAAGGSDVADLALERDSNVVVLDVERRLGARSELGAVFTLLATLDEEKVFPYLLHDVCGFDLREIAEIVGVSVTAAQSRLVRGRRLVHEALEKCDASGEERS